MTVRTAVAGGGNWTAAATWSPSGTPLAGDDCKLDATSGPVTINTGAVARSLDCTGYTETLTHTGGVNLMLGDATAGAGNIALKMVAGMTYGGSSSTNIVFVSTSATQQTITTGGKTQGLWNMSAVGGSYLLGDALTITATSTFTFAAGTFNTGNFAMSLGLFVISGASAKTLTLGSSAIAITGNSNQSVVVGGSNITFTANTAVITFTGVSSGINGGSWNGTSLVFTSAVTNAAEFRAGTFALSVNNLTYNGPTLKTAVMNFVDNATVTGTLSVQGNSTINRLHVKTGTVGTTRTVTAAAVSFSNVDFSDITAAGAAAPFTGTSMGNALGNTNITFDASTIQTRTTNAGGNWSDANWTSRVPLPQDDVVVGSLQSGTLVVDMPRIGRDILFTGGFGGTASFASVANALYGSLALGAGMTISGTQSLTLSARSSKTITSNGKTWTSGVLIVTAPGGTYTLADASLSNSLSITNGTFISAGLPITSGSVAISGTSTTIVDITNSTVTVTLASGFPWNVVNAATVLTATGSTIVYSGASASGRSFGGNGKTYGTLTYTVAGSAGALTITGNNTFNTINFSDANNTRSLLFAAGTTNTFTNFNVFGTSGKLMTIDTAGGVGTHTLVLAA